MVLLQKLKDNIIFITIVKIMTYSVFKIVLVRHLSKKQLVSSPLVPSFLWPTRSRMCLYFSTEGVYIFLRKAFIFFYGRRLYFSTEGVHIFVRKTFTFFYGRRLYFSTEGVYIILRKAFIFFYGRCKISTEKFDL